MNIVMSDVVSELRKLSNQLIEVKFCINPFHAYHSNSRRKYKNKQFIKV